MKKFFRIASLLLLLAIAPASHAGVDLYGPVQRVTLGGDGNLWFAMDTTAVKQYCAAGWHDLTIYVPKDHPQFPYYFAMLMTAAAKGHNVKVANISVFNGTTGCDITKTGYGLVFFEKY